MAIPHRRQGAVSDRQPITAQAFQSLPVAHNRRNFRLNLPIVHSLSTRSSPLILRKSVISNFHSLASTVYFDIRLQLRGNSAITMGALRRVKNKRRTRYAYQMDNVRTVSVANPD